MTQRDSSRRLHRLLRLLFLLSENEMGLSLAELAASEGLSQRTIRRDLRTLKDIGLPVDLREDTGRKRCWRISSRVADLKFSLYELLCLYLSRRLMEPFAGTPFFVGLHSAFEKLERDVFSNSTSFQSELLENFYLNTSGSSDYSDRAQLISSIMDSIRDRQVIQVDYRKPNGKASKYLLHPWSLAAHHGSLYVVAFSETAEAIRHFKLDRVQSLRTRPRHYRIPESFDVNEYFSGSFGVFSPEDLEYSISIEFSAAAAESVRESRWHRQQLLSDLPNGGVRLQLKLRSLQEVSSWILSFGSHARVTEPPELIARIRHELKQTQENYETETAPA